MHVDPIWSTENGDNLVAYMARVSNPKNQHNYTTAPKLIRFLIDHHHWSPFEMVNATFEIVCSRDISRQLLRHRSFHFQEFSQRYAQARQAPQREARLQDQKNRQNSLQTDDEALQLGWSAAQDRVAELAFSEYEKALKQGIAKEQARALLPEGLTETRLYMNGTLRSWIHFCQIRCGPETQKEARDIANDVSAHMWRLFPDSWEAAFGPEGQK